jgi:hypothetical protein
MFTFSESIWGKARSQFVIRSLQSQGFKLVSVHPFCIYIYDSGAPEKELGNSTNRSVCGLSVGGFFDVGF